MQFRTEVAIEQFDFSFDYSKRALFVGSCFATSMAQRMSTAKFNVVCNPFGVLYNPMSVASMLDDVATNRSFTRSDLTLSPDGELWCSFAFHGSFSDPNPVAALKNMNEAVQIGREALLQSDVVFITFGTAWIYSLSEGGAIVSNCHKFPSSTFGRRRLRADEIVKRYSNLLSEVLKDKKVVFTVSPIRHIKDGLHENTLSKAILMTAVAELVENNDNAYYFPSFEIVTDELRDYRFYADDMVHPSSVAVDYIWEKLQQTMFNASVCAVMDRVGRVISAASHRPLNPNSVSHRKFADGMLEKIASLQAEYPEIDFSKEKQRLKADE